LPRDQRTCCPVCASTEFEPCIDVRGGCYVQCLQCRLATLCPDQIRASQAIYTDDYFERGADCGYTDYAADEPIHRLNARRHLARMRLFGVQRPGNLLEIGCAAGFLMSEAAARGWKVFGVDVSPWSRRYVRKRFGFPVFSSVDEARENVPEGFDAITAFQVLEHIPDVKSALRSVRRALKPDGSFFVETWNRTSLTARLCGKFWQQLSPPSVVHLFDPESFTVLLKEAGFLPARLKPMLKYTSLAWAAGLVASKLGSARLARFADRAFLRRIPLPYALDDLVYLATRPAEVPPADSCAFRNRPPTPQAA
jgi:SAM-dependent methyltransferase